MHTPHTSQGIILIEAIVAIGVLTIMVVGTLSLLMRATVGTAHVSDKVVATYLAQDALEWVVAKNVYNQRTSAPFLTGLSGCGTTCDIDTALAVSTNLTACPGGDCTLYRTAAARFNHNTSLTKTPYTRTVRVTSPLIFTNSGNEAVVTVTVAWREKGGTDSVALTYNLYAL
jgi:type II secretory pathway pseudopilin PulG